MRALATALVLCLPLATAAGDLDHTRDGLLRQLYPEADSFAVRDLLLTDEVAAQLAELSHTRIRERMVTFYSATRKGTTLGHVVFHSHRVRTKAETLAVAFEADGRLKQVDIILFQEPPEYRPPDAWLTRFKGKSASDALKVGDDLDGITGATLSTRGIAAQARWLLQAVKQLPAARPASSPAQAQVR